MANENTTTKAESTAMNHWTAIDLFGGCGGLTAGLKQAGFHILSTIEMDALAASTYRVNHPEVLVLEQDIRKTPSKSFLANGVKSVDLVAGCPPCQGFSRVRRQNRTRAKRDDRNSLILEYLRVIEDLMPRAVFMENVVGLELDYRFKRFLEQLKALGYEVNWEIVQLSDHGVPQRRNRVVVLAGNGFKIPMPQATRSRPTVRHTIESLPLPRDSQNQLHNLVAHHGSKMLARIRAIPKNGGSRSAWSKDLHLQCHASCNGFKDVYGRMAWDEPAPTITGGCINVSKGRFLHPTQNRAITLFEAALLQTFPRRYHFDLVNGRYAVAEMIGNALPPRFAKRVGKTILKALAKHCHD